MKDLAVHVIILDAVNFAVNIKAVIQIAIFIQLYSR